MQTSDPSIKAIAAAAYPAYTGKKFFVSITTVEENFDLRSYWDGGSRNYYVILRLADKKVLPLPAQSAFDPQLRGAEKWNLIPGFVLVKHSISCGLDCGVTVFGLACDVTPALPEHKADLTPIEQRIIDVFCSTKPAFREKELLDPYKAEDRLTREQIGAAKVGLIAKGLLTDRNSLTMAGKNARSPRA